MSEQHQPAAAPKKAEPAAPVNEPGTAPGPVNPGTEKQDLASRTVPGSPPIVMRAVLFSPTWGIYLGNGVWSRRDAEKSKGIKNAPSFEFDVRNSEKSTREALQQTTGNIPDNARLVHLRVTGQDKQAVPEDLHNAALPSWGS